MSFDINGDLVIDYTDVDLGLDEAHLELLEMYCELNGE